MKYKIDRRGKLTYEEFANEYMYPCKPVIISGALDHWNAMGKWTPEFFKSEFGGMNLNVGDTEYGQDGYGRNRNEFTMAEFIDQVLVSTDEKPAPYFRRASVPSMFPSIKNDIAPLPEYLQPNWLGEKYLVKKVSSVLNPGAGVYIYIGGKGGTFPVLHYDGAGTHAFLMQVYGQKEYVLFQPEQEKYLYVVPHKINLSAVNVDKPDLEKHPLYSKAEPIVFVLEPGEVLFIPARWWHTVKMLTPSITISANLLNQSNWGELMRFVSQRRQSPLVSAAAWAYLSVAGARRSWRDRSWRDRLKTRTQQA